MVIHGEFASVYCAGKVGVEGFSASLAAVVNAMIVSLLVSLRGGLGVCLGGFVIRLGLVFAHLLRIAARGFALGQRHLASPSAWPRLDCSILRRRVIECDELVIDLIGRATQILARGIFALAHFRGAFCSAFATSLATVSGICVVAAGCKDGRQYDRE